jgi:tetratricopeptide (TPR) repeat protein
VIRRGVIAALVLAGTTLLGAGVAGASAEDDQLVFDSCNVLYGAQEYAKAADCYRTLVDDGVHNGPLYMNLGNAHLHLGNLGEAIYHYRQAQVFLPRDSELKAHLAEARSAAELGHVEPAGPALGHVFFFYDSLSPGELWVVVAILNALLWGLLAIRLFRRGEILTWSAVVVALGLAVFGGTAAVRQIELETRPTAVVLSGTAVLHSGRDRAASELARLAEGVEIRVRARQGGWLEVSYPGGTRGWVEEGTLGVIEYRRRSVVRGEQDEDDVVLTVDSVDAELLEEPPATEAGAPGEGAEASDGTPSP